MSRKFQRGFSLVELVIVITILGVLGAISVPMYQGHVRSTNRATAKALLVEGAQSLQGYFTRNNTFIGATVGNTGAGAQVSEYSTGSNYKVSLDIPDAGSFTLTATAQGGQSKDKCPVLTVDHLGRKTPADCW